MTTGKSTVVAKFQTTVPTAIREIFHLNEGDILHWEYTPSSETLVVKPMRAALITPRLRAARERAITANRDGETSALAVDNLVKAAGVTQIIE